MENKVAYEISVTKISSNENSESNEDGIIIKTHNGKGNFVQAD